MQTTHRWLTADARGISAAETGAVQLVVTSPPYPMIQMWDAAFGAMSPAAAAALAAGDGPAAFEQMHAELDRVWAACHAVLTSGGFLCVNIGDATRTVDKHFRLYPNHARIVSALVRLGFTVLPDILWRKPTNAPNKFMGSGMLPAGAYVTYEHEYILIARKGGKRVFRTPEARLHRAQSAYFWEERNVWFSDLWSDLRGTRQSLPDDAARRRSAAFPFSLAHRLVCMYSVYGDTVLDPFAGTGTTAAAALAAGRSSVSVEHEARFAEGFAPTLRAAVDLGAGLAAARLAEHRGFVAQRSASGKLVKHHNAPHDVPVMTRQEAKLELRVPAELAEAGDAFTASHGVLPA